MKKLLLSLTALATAASAQYVAIEPKILADLTSAPTVTVGGVSAAWNSGEIVLSASSAQAKYPKNGGLCAFPVTYEIRNKGGTSAAFSVKWASKSPDVVIKSFAPLPAGATQSGSFLMTFPAAAQALAIQIDPQNAVQELNEKNNTFRVRVQVKGSCAP